MSKQYTIRNVPNELDSKLRSLASRKNQSLNTLLLEQLARSVEAPSKKSKINHDFDDLFNTMTPDPAFTDALQDNRLINPKEW